MFKEWMECSQAHGLVDLDEGFAGAGLASCYDDTFSGQQFLDQFARRFGGLIAEKCKGGDKFGGVQGGSTFLLGRVLDELVELLACSAALDPGGQILGRQAHHAHPLCDLRADVWR